MVKTFIDTNIVVYANDKRDLTKQEAALAVIGRLLENGSGVISTQVLQEYAAVAVSKLHQDHAVVQRQLLLLETLEVVIVTGEIVRRAVEMSGFNKISYWDACIIAAAEKAGCDSILSEDLSTGHFYAGIRIDNPLKR